MLERDDVDVEGVPVAVLRMAHGPVNAMDLELCQALAGRFSDLADDPARAVVVTGSDRAFSAGVDLKRATAGGDAYIDEFLPALADAFRAAFELPKPLVAAVNGHAIAGGCVLAACADVVLMAEGTARIGVPELRVGVPFPRIALEVVRHAVGERGAREVVLGAQTHLPERARELGLVHEVVPAAQLGSRAVAAAAALAAEIPPDTFATTKWQLRREALERVDRLADEHERVAALWKRHIADGWVARYLEAATKR
ncbi:MAG TPA: enoyl-CoA hydratase/isomerase family protein [Pseudonocardia sp.]|uniref:enoyl-CoA hydratase/isomerase family protein n=1 Tax=Pseudonocardia sp. TaxID=60912 RepID=UPI002B4B2F15|nr:enoyl-CoA hydratase/isomerase family protein [Pseudonocardia sp.]HLU57066.1 enoyl-CoA hydratase/isomerase family protein [Pseudonocardia sp.]